MDLDAAGSRLRIKQVHLDRSAVLYELNHIPGFAREMASPRTDVIDLRRPRQVRQHRAAKAQCGALEKMPTAQIIHRNRQTVSPSSGSAMLFTNMKQHTVMQGECIGSIACNHGFFWQTVWNDPANAALKQKRKDPNVLMPGDTVAIPELRGKVEQLPLNKRHTFKLKGVPAKFYLRLLEAGKPRANEPYTLEIDGLHFKGTTNASGEINVYIPPGAQSGLLVVGTGDSRSEYSLQLGLLDPADELSGAQARLENLGFHPGENDGKLSPETIQALRAFQASHGLPVTGQLDAATQKKLNDSHDGK